MSLPETFYKHDVPLAQAIQSCDNPGLTPEDAASTVMNMRLGITTNNGHPLPPAPPNTPRR